MDFSLIPLAELNFRTLPEQLVNGIFIGAVYALIALGYTMVYGVLRLINFAHGEVYMLGAYAALFVSWGFGFTPAAAQAGTLQASILVLLAMMLVSMIVCAGAGVLIERFAYRPMRGSSRISLLITAIGVSLLLQHGGSLFLPNDPPPTISPSVNPAFFQESKTLTIMPPSEEVKQAVVETEGPYQAARTEYEKYLEESGEDRFNLSEEGIAKREVMQEAERSYNLAKSEESGAGVKITMQISRLILLGTALVLMLILRHLVMFTSVGRAMRAVSHDFDSASLMGINVNKTVMITFVIGSSLAGAAAMMTGTFLGTPISSFYGFLPGVKAFVAAVLGGIGNIPGAVLGGLLMGIAETFVTWLGYGEFKDAIAFVILIAVLLFRPGGLLGSSKVEKV